jgi:cell division protein FtsL
MSPAAGRSGAHGWAGGVGGARTLTRENDRLKLELATLKNPARLERLAREKLGMAMPSGPVVIAVPAERTVPARAAARLEQREARVQVADRGEAR